MDTRQTMPAVIESVNQFLQRLNNLTSIIERTLSYPVKLPQLIAQQNALLNQKNRLMKMQQVYNGVCKNLQLHNAGPTQEAKLKSLMHEHTIELDDITSQTLDLLSSLKKERTNNSALSSIVNDLDIKWKHLQTELRDCQEEILDRADEFNAESFAFRRLNNFYATVTMLSDAMSQEVNVSKSSLNYYQSQLQTLRHELNEEYKLETLEVALTDLENAQGFMNDKLVDDTVMIFQLYLQGMTEPDRKQSFSINTEDFDLMVNEYKKVYQKVLAKADEISQTKKHTSLVGSQRLMGLFDAPSAARTKLEPNAPVAKRERGRLTQKR